MRPSRLELWAGPESTVNRVGDTFLDQFVLSGHRDRLSDLDLIATLPISALRYPVSWERTAPDGLDRADWRWIDRRMRKLRDLGIRPIAGLVHHGSGPRHTSLVDPGFAEGLARFARAVAERYPWVDAYTPVNEPLTTARFSGLYGHWYPHGRDDGTFVQALLTQCRGIILAMEAIRSVNPAARLVQTDDLGKTFSTPALAHQAEFDNERRWLSFDLLCGRVDRDHPLWEYLLHAGPFERDLEWLLERARPPDILGIDHYLSSERFLDDQVHLYPAHEHGSNGRIMYTDTLAARVRREGPDGPRALLREAWDRYGLPLAITEAHNACTREEQMRWFLEVWQAAEDLREEGVDLRAVTAWALFGAHGWDTLVTRPDGRYESGVFDLRSPQPRPTAMVSLLQELGAGRRPSHPLLLIPGWWRRGCRAEYGHVVGEGGRVESALRRADEMHTERWPDVPPLLVVGPSDALRACIMQRLELRGIPYKTLGPEHIDSADEQCVRHTLASLRPWAVVNVSGCVEGEAEADPERCRRETVLGPAILAEACAGSGISFLTFSSHLVFDGRKGAPYVESDPVSPFTPYGQMKAEGERAALATMPGALIVRTGALFGPWDRSTFLTAALRALWRGATVRAIAEQTVSPTYMPDLVDASLDLLIDGEGGIWHLTNGGSATPAGLVRRAAALAGLPHDRVIDVRSPDSEMRGARPVYSVLDSERGRLLPDLDDALVRYLQACDIRTPGPQVAELQTTEVQASAAQPSEAQPSVAEVSEVQASHLHTFNQPGTAPCPSELGAAGIARAETLSGSAGQPADLTETGAAAAAQ